MHIFISHSTKDGDIASRFASFLENISPDINVFCSSSFGAIRHGESFVKAIERELARCDLFFVLLSNNYIKSKYCLIELGFAYGRLVHSEHNIIRPYILPDGEGLLDGTPLRDLQYYPLLDERTLRGFINEVEDSDIEVLVRNDDIRSFIRKARSLYLTTSDIFNESQVICCCSNPSIPNAIKCERIDNKYIVNFSLPSNGANKLPDFVSVVLNFYNDLNLLRYYESNNDLSLHCEIENYTGSLRSIQIEFQTDNNRLITDPSVINLSDSITEIDIPISTISKYRKYLEQVVNICFVVKGEYLLESEGSFTITNLHIQ